MRTVRTTKRSRSRSTRVAVLLGGVAALTLAARRRGYKLGPNTIVRCRQGHLFTTIWIPGVNLKSIDLGLARIQRCPVGKHWTLVRPVRESDLTEEQRAEAHATRDIRIP